MYSCSAVAYPGLGRRRVDAVDGTYVHAHRVVAAVLRDDVSHRQNPRQIVTRKIRNSTNHHMRPTKLALMEATVSGMHAIANPAVRIRPV